MPNLVPLLNDKKLFATADGSISFYNLTYEEAYHAKSIGAYTESLYKYVLASGIREKLLKKSIKLLDIGFGLGYNIAVTIEKTLDLKNRLHIVSLEKDKELINIVYNLEILWPVNGFKILKKLIKNGEYDKYYFDLRYGDAVTEILKETDSYDVIYFDPFSKNKNSEMWSRDVINKLYDILKDDGVITTYACSKKIREEFRNIGFKYLEIENLPDSFQKGTIFHK
ncbi:MAG: MnmC family methyltransferase [Calditerrivibrio sp.]|nr:MnmC family methyltransferase [Calditerrivibrio sp.]